MCSQVSVQCSECQSGEKFKPTRVNGGSIYDSLKVTSWVNGGRSHDSLKVASALTVKVMEIQTCVAPSEIWLRDDLQNIYALLFRFLGYGFRLAMSKVGWLTTQKFVILMPDPIVFAPFVRCPDFGRTLRDLFCVLTATVITLVLFRPTNESRSSLS